MESVEFQLTQCQHTASSGIVAWSHDKDDLFATLAGAAGTGKSWLSRFILEQIPQRRICVSAPTHQALNHIMRASGYEGHTLQSLLGLRPDTDVEDFDPNNVKFDRKNEPKIKYYDFIILDEASMAQIGLVKFVKEQCEKYGCKILFVGDHVQLPPVGETSSSVFKPETVNGNVFKLETPCRQAMSNPLYLLLLALRSDVEGTQTSWDFVMQQLDYLKLLTVDLETTLLRNPTRVYKILIDRFPTLVHPDTGEGYGCYTNNREYENSLAIDSEADFLAGRFDGTRALAWRNDVVGYYNKGIRYSIFDTDDIITPGDLIKCYRPITEYDPNTKQVYTLVHNSQELRISSANLEQSYYQGIRVYSCVLESLDSDASHIVDFVHPDDYQAYLAVYEEKRRIASQTKKWGNFYQFFDGHLLLESLSKKYNNKRFPHKAFDYAYALTVHKSQGSTFEKVYTDTQDIREYYKIQKQFLERDGKWDTEARITHARITRQLLYVALSRASNYANILL